MHVHREALRLSFRSLVRRPAESLLLTVSVALAVGATVTGAVLANAGAAISERLPALLRYREIVVSTRAESSTMKLPARPRLATSVVLTAEDLQHARSMSPAVQYAYVAEMEGWSLNTTQASPKPQRESLSGMAVTPGFFAARNLVPAAGSLFTATDVARGEPVMVLGARLGAALFEDGMALDRTLRTDGRRYRIIGVLEPSGASEDDFAFTPLPGAGSDNQSDDSGVTIRFRDRRSLRFAVADRESLDAAREQLISYFDATYGAGLVQVSDPAAEAQLLAGRFRGVVRIVLFLTALVVAVASLYMANVFAARALRKRRSVGILKALGATGAEVFVVFLVEAMAIGAAGAVAGLQVAVVLMGIVLYAVRAEVPVDIDPTAALALTWLIFAACSLLPAAAAVRAPAAEAMRYE